MLIVPKLPATFKPTLAAALGKVPATMPVTVLVSPPSTSVSLVSTLPVGFVPAVALAMPPLPLPLQHRKEQLGLHSHRSRLIVMVRSKDSPF